MQWREEVGAEIIDSGRILEVSVRYQVRSVHKEGLNFYPLLIKSIRNT